MSETTPATPPQSLTVAVTVFGDGRAPRIDSQISDPMAICRILSAAHEVLLAASIQSARQGPVQPVVVVPSGGKPVNGLRGGL